ncbi:MULTISPECIES: hypothetical protein [Streptomyces]|uniref:Uncharacterized protein n=1 Tax=Streptomyces sulfonofaciens TaxID=68272 RepID=A0A919G5A9_9ACTN|nr:MULTISPECIES: hypothetical protein [Streptomyces]GHH77550.1 hypothetical protein GCM10018793_25890 [Streptomyces sulfonofaciens]GHJ35290.1 hypothetical protein Sm713_08990 [Streptomyces sp. TS71-3]
MISTGVAVSLVVLFGIITVLLVRSRDVRVWEAVCIALFGVYLGHTPAVATIDGFVTWIFSGFSHF